MSNTVDNLNITNILTCEDAILTSLVADNMQTNNIFCDNALITNLSCNNITLDISQNLNLTGNFSALNIAGNQVNCNLVSAQQILRSSDNVKYATMQDISNVYNSIVNGAPVLLDTIQEIANAINQDVSFGATIFNRITALDNSYNNVTIPKLTNIDTSLNSILLRDTAFDTSLNTHTSQIASINTTMATKLTNEINQDIFLTGNLYIKPTNKFIQFLNSSLETMSTFITKSDYTTFNNVSSKVSLGWNFSIDNLWKVNINNNGDINMSGSINSNGNATYAGFVSCNDIRATKITFPNLPSINHIQRGLTTLPGQNGNVRIQFDKVYPSTPSVTCSPVYAGLGYVISIIISAVDTTGFNYNIFAISSTGSYERFEKFAQVSWIAIG